MRGKMGERREVGSAAAELRELGGGDDEGRRKSATEKEIRRSCASSQRGGGGPWREVGVQALESRSGGAACALIASGKRAREGVVTSVEHMKSRDGQRRRSCGGVAERGSVVEKHMKLWRSCVEHMKSRERCGEREDRRGRGRKPGWRGPCGIWERCGVWRKGALWSLGALWRGGALWRSCVEHMKSREPCGESADRQGRGRKPGGRGACGESEDRRGRGRSTRTRRCGESEDRFDE